MSTTQHLWPECPLSKHPRKLHLLVSWRIPRQPLWWLCRRRRVQPTGSMRTWSYLYQFGWRKTVSLPSRWFFSSYLLVAVQYLCWFRLRRRPLHNRLSRFERMRTKSMRTKRPLFQLGGQFQVHLPSRIYWRPTHRLFRYYFQLQPHHFNVYK